MKTARALPPPHPTSLTSRVRQRPAGPPSPCSEGRSLPVDLRANTVPILPREGERTPQNGAARKPIRVPKKPLRRFTPGSRGRNGATSSPELLAGRESRSPDRENLQFRPQEALPQEAHHVGLGVVGRRRERRGTGPLGRRARMARSCAGSGLCTIPEKRHGLLRGDVPEKRHGRSCDAITRGSPTR